MIVKSFRKDGTVEMRRPPYRPGAYSVKDETLADLRRIREVQSFAEATASHDGLLLGYTCLQTFERDGHTWHLFQANGTEHLIEIEVDDGEIVQVLPLPPERAWRVALQQDRALRPEIIYE